MADQKQNSLRRWRKFFSTAGADIFEVIDRAIDVAALDHLGELKERRDRIVQKIFAASVPAAAVDDMSHYYSDDDGEAVPVREQVTRIKDRIVAKNDDEAALLVSLRRLQSMPMTSDTLEATKIGVAVNGLKKHRSEQVRGLATTLIGRWKALVDQRFGRLSSDAAPVADAKTSPTPESSTSKSSSSSCNKWEAPVLEAKLEAAKRKLHEGYEEAEKAKRQRKIQVIVAPEMRKQMLRLKQHPIMRLRREVKCAATSTEQRALMSSLRMSHVFSSDG